MALCGMRKHTFRPYYPLETIHPRLAVSPLNWERAARSHLRERAWYFRDDCFPSSPDCTKTLRTKTNGHKVSTHHICADRVWSYISTHFFGLASLCCGANGYLCQCSQMNIMHARSHTCIHTPRRAACNNNMTSTLQTPRCKPGFLSPFYHHFSS